MTIEYFAESNPVTRTLPRSVATRAGGFVFVGGQVARDEDGGIIAGAFYHRTKPANRSIDR